MAIPADLDWQYPDLLSKDGLISILKQRYIQHKDLEALDKEELVKLYNDYIIPLPQRTYNLNRRGRQMTQKQVKLAKKRKIAITEEEDSQPIKKKPQSNGSAKGLVNSFVAPSSRLKPPPSCINFEKKVVKLTSSTPHTGGDGSGSESTTTQTAAAMESDTKTTDDETKAKKKFTKISWP